MKILNGWLKSMKSALYAAIVYTIAYIDPDMRGKPQH